MPSVGEDSKGQLADVGTTGEKSRMRPQRKQCRPVGLGVLVRPGVCLCGDREPWEAWIRATQPAYLQRPPGCSEDGKRAGLEHGDPWRGRAALGTAWVGLEVEVLEGGPWWM